MPCLKQLSGSLSLYIYADDHLPPHFHLLGPNTDVQIRIGTLEPMAGEYTRKDLALALAWAVDNLILIETEWRRLNERD
jgi:hypothetical protein